MSALQESKGLTLYGLHYGHGQGKTMCVTDDQDRQPSPGVISTAFHSVLDSIIKQLPHTHSCQKFYLDNTVLRASVTMKKG